MDGGLTLAAAPTTSSSPSPSLPLRFLLPHSPSQLCLSLAPRRRSSRLSFYPRDPGLHHWDLNRAKVSAHKANPGASFFVTEGFLSKKPSLKFRKPPDPIEGPLAEELLALDRMGSEGAESLGLEEPDLEGTESPGLEKPDGERKPAEKVAKESPDIALRKPTRLEDKVWPRASASDKTGKGVDVKRLDDNLLLRKPVIVSSDIVGDTSNFSSADNSTENDAATTDDNLTSESDQMAASFTSQATLTGEPQRSYSPTNRTSGLQKNALKDGVSEVVDYEYPVSSSGGEYDESDWRRAEELLQTGGIEEVEFVSCSDKGFFVSFGSLVGFLPYRDLITTRRFLAFESWLRRKGLDPFLYRKNLGIVRSYEVQDIDLKAALEYDKKGELNVHPGMAFEELLGIYNHEKTKFLSSFLGQKIRASVVLVDRESKRLLFSARRKENGDISERKRQLMDKLKIGDIVQCCVKKIIYYGVFVEIEGVPALIHQTEISWDIALDPSVFFKIGQIIYAKVHQLNYALERIFLSLKGMNSNPEEYAVGEQISLGARIEHTVEDAEWTDIESLVKELEKIDGITNVSKGRFFLSSSLVPTFQVYMGSMQQNKYKLLARFENKVQEVLVESSLEEQQIKEAVLICTNRVS